MAISKYFLKQKKMNSVKVGLLTIGQSPREDVVPEIKPLFLPYIEIQEIGLLDDLSREEIQDLQPERGEAPLVTRLRDGSQVQLSEQKVVSLLPNVIESVKKKMDIRAVGVLCTHDFAKINFPIPVIFPFDYIYYLTTHVLNVGRIGVVIPLENQIEMAKKKWEKEEAAVEVKSPYSRGKNWKKIAQRFTRENVEAVILDCIGYKIKDKREIQDSISVPILLPRIILAFAINQLFNLIYS